MFRTTLAIAAVSLLPLSALADHQHGPPRRDGQLLRYTAQIRSQMALVQAQADATCSSRLVSGDIYRELDGLCRELDRLEDLAARPVISRGDYRRIERAALRVDEQSREVEGAVRSALADPRRFGGPGFLPTTRPTYYPGVTTSPGFATGNVGQRGIQLVIGGGRVGVNIGSPLPTPYVAARPVAFGGHGHRDAAGDALCAETDNLRLMTRQLVALVTR
jgi:hypothetical protein